MVEAASWFNGKYVIAIMEKNIRQEVQKHMTFGNMF